MFFIFKKILCLNCNDRGEGSIKIKNVSINNVSVAVTGGRGQIRLKMSQLKMSQLGLRGGRVKLIETMSQNLQFFFFEGFP